jgi:tetratricopeptide (TPR) repeat protein
MKCVKRIAALLALVGVVAAGVVFLQRVRQDGRYRALLLAGERALDAGDPAAAIEAFSGAIALRPDAMVAFFRRGEIYHAERRDDEAIRDLRDAARLAPDAPQPLVALGDVYDGQGDRSRAAVWYGQAAVRLKDQDPGLLYKLALARYRAGAPASAVEPLRTAIGRNDSIGQTHYLLGLVYRDMGNVDGALASLERAVRVAPSLIAAHEELADLYRSRGRLVDEMRQLEALATLDPRVDRIVAIGLAQARQAQFDQALATLALVAAQTPVNPRVQLALARVCLARAERSHDRPTVSRALDILRRTRGDAAEGSEGLALLGRAQYLAGDYVGAERVLRDAVARAPVDAEAFEYLADAADRLSHELDARDALLKLDLLDGELVSAEVRAVRAQRIGTLALRAGDAAGAADYLNRAVKAGLTDAPTWGSLARARWQIGDVTGAQDALAHALALDARDPDLLRLRRIIR